MKHLRVSFILLLTLLACFGSFVTTFAQVQVINQRQIAMLEKAKRPHDPWPRGDGHALIGEPGSPLIQKGYHEPGGSFTPSPGGFSVSIWVLDKQGKLIATSDNIPMEKIQQQYIHKGDSKIPSIENTTPYYTSTWTRTDAGVWTLELGDQCDSCNIELVFRSVGPAGGPLSSVIWDQSRIILDRKWIGKLDVAPSSIIIGDESTGELQKAKPGKESVVSESGWGFARLGIDKSFKLTLTDTRPQYGSMLSYNKTSPQFSLQMPDKRFEASLTAQLSTLMMGYIGRQTGPGEPINYPLAWERDGAYSLMAMAKSGSARTAARLPGSRIDPSFYLV